MLQEHGAFTSIAVLENNNVAVSALVKRSVMLIQIRKNEPPVLIRDICFLNPVATILGSDLLNKQALLVRDTRAVYFLNVFNGKCVKVNDVPLNAAPTAKNCYSNLISFDKN